MFLDLGENRPDTPRVPTAFTRLERVLIAVVAYQFLLLAYFLAPDSWVQPVKQIITPQEPMRFVQVAPAIERMPPPAAVQPRAARTPAPRAEPAAPPPALGTDAPLPPIVEAPRAAEAPPAPKAPPQTQPPAVARRFPGSILDSARRALERSAPAASAPAPVDEDGPAIQFDTRGIDFGPWLRRFKAQVVRNWFIPSAVDLYRGHVIITMRVLRNGTLTNIEIVKSSGIEPFDRAALNALRLSTPTVPYPDEYPLDAIDPFTVIFYYNEPVR